MHDNLPVLREVIHKVISRCQLMLHLSGEKNPTETDGCRCRQQLHGAMAVLRSTDRARQPSSTEHTLANLATAHAPTGSQLHGAGSTVLLCRGRQLRVLRDTIARDGRQRRDHSPLLSPRLSDKRGTRVTGGQSTGGTWHGPTSNSDPYII